MRQDANKIQYTYGVIREEYLLSDGRCDRVAYGVAAYAHTAETGSTTVVAAVHDITAHPEHAARLAARCNRCGLSPRHLADAAEDCLL